MLGMIPSIVAIVTMIDMIETTLVNCTACKSIITSLILLTISFLFLFIFKKKVVERKARGIQLLLFRIKEI